MVRARRLNIRKTIFGGMFVVSLLIIMVFVSYSWFNSGEKATVTGITMNVAEGEELLIKAVGDEDGSKTLQMEFPQGLTLKSVAGDGQYFYDAKVGFSDEPIKDGEVEIYQRVPVGYTPIDVSGGVDSYIAAGIFAFDFSFFIEKDTPVYIYGKDQVSNRDGSSVKPAPPESYPPLDTNEAGEVETLPNGELPRPNHLSPYGTNIDKGEICAAIRIAILQKNAQGEYDLKFVWAPNSTKRLIKSGDGNYSFVDNGQVEDEYLLIGSYEELEDGTIAVSETKIATQNKTSGEITDTITGVTYAWGELTTHKIGDLVSNTYCDFRVVVWVDGNDKDCDNALLDGLITVNLDFGTILNEEVNDEETGN